MTSSMRIRTSATRSRSGPATPSLEATRCHALLKFVSCAISPSVTGGDALLVVCFDFGSSPERGGLLPLRSAEFPFGLSAVSKRSSSCTSVSLTVIAFP